MADVRIISRVDSCRVFVDGVELRHVRAYSLSFDADHQRHGRLLVEFVATDVAVEADNVEVATDPSTPIPRG